MSDQLADAARALHRSPAEERSVIFNVDPSNKLGSHWVAARLTPSTLEWFDSYGLPPDGDDPVLHDRTHFREWCERLAPRGGYEWNHLDFQALSSAVCGQYALWFCRHGLPDADHPAWRSFYQLPGAFPHRIRGLSGLWRQDQSVAAARDGIIRELVRLE